MINKNFIFFWQNTLPFTAECSASPVASPKAREGRKHKSSNFAKNIKSLLQNCTGSLHKERTQPKGLGISILAIWLMAFLTLPFISLASPIQTGSACVPDDPAKDQTCQYCAQWNSNEIMHLKWQIPDAHYLHPFCSLDCHRDDGQSCTFIYNKDSNNVANYGFDLLKAIINSTNTGNFDNFNIKPTDDIYIKDASKSDFRPGNIYQVSCCEREDPYNITLLHWCKDNSKQNPYLKSGPMTIVGCGQACELPFETIVSSLNEVGFTPITENSFRDWASRDDKDFAGETPMGISPGAGSGDIDDIRNYMIFNHPSVCFGTPVVTEETWKPEIDTLKKIVPSSSFPNKQDIVQLGLSFYRKDNNWSAKKDHLNSHSVIATSIIENADGNGDGAVVVKYLDPNGPTNDRKIYCGRSQDNAPTNWLCYSPDWDVFVMLYFTEEDLQKQSSLSMARNNIVNPNSSFCNDPRHSDYCNRIINQWVQDNYPNIDNDEFTTGGKCAGWTDVVMRVAYLGAFVGTDYHPNDGKTIGADCDIYHYPGQKTSRANPQNWLAALTNVWLAALTDIWNIFKK